MNSYEIAKLAGVSVMTVSRVINGSPNVAEKTRKKIEELITLNGYTPSPTARNLAGKHSNILGLYLADINSDEKNTTPAYEAPYFVSFISSIIGVANKKGYKVLVNIINDESQLTDMIHDFKSRVISGGIFLGFENGTRMLTELAGEGFKMVLLDQDMKYFPETDNLIFADIDDEMAAVNVIKYLASLGHKRIGHIRHTTKRLSSVYRYEGYLKGLFDCGLKHNPDYVGIGKGTEQGSYTAMCEILDKTGSGYPTAIFAATDLMASYTIKAILDRGLRVPDDISVVGYDDTYLAKYSNPSITSVNVPIGDIAEYAVTNLIKMINSEPYEFEHVFQTMLVERESVRKI